MFVALGGKAWHCMYNLWQGEGKAYANDERWVADVQLDLMVDNAGLGIIKGILARKSLHIYRLVSSRGFSNINSTINGGYEPTAHNQIFLVPTL